MRRRSFPGTCAAGLLHAREREASPIEPHFATAAHRVVWRNWDLAPVASARAAAMQLWQPHIAGPCDSRLRFKASHEDLHWTAPYGPDRVTRIFAAMAQQWRSSVDEFTAALRRHPAARPDLRIRRAVLLYFRGISNQVAFHSRRQTPGALPALPRDEITIANEFLQVCRADSCIGFKASRAYFYLPPDLREIIVSCRCILNELGAA